MSEWMYWLTKYSNNCINFVGNCSSYQVLSLEQITQDIEIGHQYQFGIELTTASSCHCVTITSATESFGTNLLNSTENLWCNKILQQSFNQLCASSTTNMTFGSKVLNAKGNFAFSSYCKDQWGLIPTNIPSSGDNSNTGVCPEFVNPSPPLITMTLFESSSVTYTLPYSSPIPTLATPTLISASHTNHGVSQTSARPSLTSLGVSPSPTMLFCSENGTSPMTLACTMANATSTDCGNNFSRAKG